MSLTDKVEYMSPADKKYMMALENKKSQSVSLGGRRHGGFRPSLSHEPQLEQYVPVRTVQSKEGIDSESNYGRGKHGGRKVGGKAPSVRGAIVKKVMQEHGLSLPQASKYVKEHGLY